MLHKSLVRFQNFSVGRKEIMNIVADLNTFDCYWVEGFSKKLRVFRCLAFETQDKNEEAFTCGFYYRRCCHLVERTQVHSDINISVDVWLCDAKNMMFIFTTLKK
jgi:hypothetical protein